MVNMTDAKNNNQDQDPARVAAQELDHESPTESLPPESGEKLNVRTDMDASNSSIEPASKDDEKADLKTEGSKIVDPELAEDEETIPAPVKIPRAQRRGLFGRFTLLAEVEEPKHYPRKTKWFITFIVAFAAIAAPMGSAIIFREQPP